MKTTLIIPTLNEIEGVCAVMPRIHKDWVDEVLCVDGGSDDGTVEYMWEWGADVMFQTGTGIANAEWEAIQTARGDCFITFTADGSSKPEFIPVLRDILRGGCDLVLASRYKHPATSEDDDCLTALGNWGFTRATNLLFGSKLTDVLVGFRGFNRRLVKLMAYTPEPVLELQMICRALKAGCTICEVAASEPKRIGGKRKMRPFYNGSCLLATLVLEKLL